jgi:mono/diheme cytochrome c family protein
MKILRWLGITASALVALVLVALAVVYVLSERRIAKHYTIAGVEVPGAADSATLAWGLHVAETRGCTNCHTPSLGGSVFIDVPPVARLYAANLTSGAGGVAARYTTTADWERSIRHGVAPDGRALLFMPSQEFYTISDQDLGALISYIKARPAVDHQLGRQSVGPIGRALLLAGKVPLLPAELIDHARPRPTAPAPGVTIEYGHYLAGTCTGCHGGGFSGGQIPGAPPEMAIPLNITPDSTTGIGRWSQAEFTKAIRTGIRPDGAHLKPDMPVQNFARYSDDEVAAIWMYLRTVPAKAYGGR